jgi:hypothetical protein
MSQWEIIGLITLTSSLMVTAWGRDWSRFTPDIVFRSILIWGAIVLVIAMVVLNRHLIAGWLAPIRAMMP